jgi:hypothetical protein
LGLGYCEVLERRQRKWSFGFREVLKIINHDTNLLSTFLSYQTAIINQDAEVFYLKHNTYLCRRTESVRGVVEQPSP